MADNSRTTEGRCQCGGVHFRLHGALPDIKACHCAQCRQMTSNFFSSTAVAPECLEFVADASLGWYRSSDVAERGFCTTCGSSLFWRPLHHPRIAVSAGALDQPTGLRTLMHIFCANKGDFYEISDGLPQYPGDDED